MQSSSISVIEKNNKIACKPYLKKIIERFSWSQLQDKPVSKFSFYPYANDIQYLYHGDYLSKFNSLNRFNFFSNSQPDNRIKKIGLVVGNGYILSLLPDLLVNDVILIDIEPAVHNFILFVKDLILSTDDSNFCQQREIIKHKINLYCDKIKSYRLLAEEDTLESEMQALGEKHFLSSVERFNQCKKALIEKDIIPIHLNILDYKSVDHFATLLRDENLQVSFINITNMGDYDRFRILYYNLCNLPLAKEFVIISTSLISSSNRENEFPKACLIADNLEQLEKNLQYNYLRNMHA